MQQLPKGCMSRGGHPSAGGLHRVPASRGQGGNLLFSHSVVSDSCDPMVCSPPGSSVHGFHKQEYRNGLSFPSAGNLPNPGIKPCISCLAGGFTPLQCSCLANPMDGGAWWAAVHGVTKSRTRLSDFTFTFHFHALEKAMATHPSVLAWRIPGTGEPGGLPSMGSHRLGHD